MFSFYSSPRICSVRDVDFLPVGSFKFCIFPVSVLSLGEEGCRWGLLAAGSPEATRVRILPPGNVDMAHRILASCGQRAVGCKAADAWTSPLEHRVCGYPGKREGPLKMCYGDMKPSRGGDVFNYFSFFVTSRDDLESVMGRYGISFIYHFSMYLVATYCGPGIKLHRAYGVSKKMCPCPDPAVKVRRSFLLAVTGGGGKWLHSKFSSAAERIVSSEALELRRSSQGLFMVL